MKIFRKRSGYDESNFELDWTLLIQIFEYESNINLTISRVNQLGKSFSITVSLRENGGKKKFKFNAFEIR